MDVDQIIEIGIDASARLYVKPESKSFPYIYREALEVNWDESHNYLYGAKPRQWQYIDWYVQILSAANVQGCELKLAKECSWVSVPDELKQQIMENSN